MDLRLGTKSWYKYHKTPDISRKTFATTGRRELAKKLNVSNELERLKPAHKSSQPGLGNIMIPDFLDNRHAPATLRYALELVVGIITDRS
jgi:hypothetical protein